MSPPGILPLAGLPAALAASQAAAGMAAGPAARAAMAAANDGDAAGSQATVGYGETYSPTQATPLIHRPVPPRRLADRLWRRGPERKEPLPETVPPPPQEGPASGPVPTAPPELVRAPMQRRPPPLRLSIPLPDPNNLKQIEAALRAVAAKCPRDKDGHIDIRPLKVGYFFIRRLRWSDGQISNTERLLRAYDSALGAQAAKFPGEWRSERRLMAVFRRVLKEPHLVTTTQARISGTVIPVSVHRFSVSPWTDTTLKALKEAWEYADAHQISINTNSMTAIIVHPKHGPPVRLRDLLKEYWSRIQPQGSRNTVESDVALDLIYFRLFNGVRTERPWEAKVETVLLPMSPNEAFPDTTTLNGNLKILSKALGTYWMGGQMMFPLDRDGTHTYFLDPQSGRSIRYATILRALQIQIARAKISTDPAVRATVREIEMDSGFIDNIRPRRNILIHENTRRSLVAYLKKYQGLAVAAPQRSVVRRGPAGRQPIFALGPAQWSPSEMGEPFPLEMGGARMVGMPRDSHGILSAHLAWANVAGSYLLARMSDGMGLAIPPQPPSPLDLGDMLADEANDLAARLAVLRRYSPRARQLWDELAFELENTTGTLAEKLPRIREFVEAQEARLAHRLSKPPPDWKPEPITVPPELRRRLETAYGTPERIAAIADLSHAFNYYFGDMGGLPPGRRTRLRHKSTGDHVYGDTVHRQLLHLVPLTTEEEAARDAVAALVRRYHLADFGGHWWALGIKLPRRDQRTIPSTLRFYFSVHPQHAAEAMTALIGIVAPYVRAVRDVQFKMAQDPREWRGDDGIVVYTGREQRALVKAKLMALEAEHPDWFREPLGTPLAARLIREDGKPSTITIAQSPKEASESVNGPLAAAATRALQWWRLQRARGNLPHVHEVIDWVARRLRDSGRDLHHPALLAEDQDLHRPGWVAYLDTFVQTDQFYSDDVPQVLSLLEVELQAANGRYEHGATETLRTLRVFRQEHRIPVQLPPELKEGSGNGYTVGGLRMILKTVMRRYAQLPPN